MTFLFTSQVAWLWCWLGYAKTNFKIMKPSLKNMQDTDKVKIRREIYVG